MQSEMINHDGHEWHIEYSIHGRIKPATRWEPAEDIEVQILSVSRDGDKYDGDLPDAIDDEIYQCAFDAYWNRR